MEITTAGMAPFERVAESVRQSIRTNTLKPRDKLASNREMAKQHGVSLATLQKALNRLQEEGWLVSRASVGVFVANTPPDSDVTTLKDVHNRLADLQAEVAELRQRVARIEGTTPPAE